MKPVAQVDRNETGLGGGFRAGRPPDTRTCWSTVL